MKELTQEQFLGLIRDDVEKAGSQKALAAKLDVSETYLSDVLNNRREPSRKILSRYKMRAVVSYAPAKKEKK